MRDHGRKIKKGCDEVSVFIFYKVLTRIPHYFNDILF